MQGVGSCWIGDFVEGEVKKMLSIPERGKVVALISMGIPDEQPGPKPKKPIEEIVHYNRW